MNGFQDSTSASLLPDKNYSVKLFAVAYHLCIYLPTIYTMRLIALSALLALTAVGVNGLAPQRQVLVTYPQDTPESALDNAKDAIKASVGSSSDE